MVKISVLMATRNGEQYISDAIISILRQSFTDFEFIICNDGSTDQTLQIVEKFAAQDNRIKVINNKNAGFSQALNSGLRACNGTYIARMDDDDIALPNRLAVENSFLDNNKEVSIVGTAIKMFDDEGIFGQRRYILKPSRLDIWRGKIFAHPTVMFRREIYNRIGGYSENRAETRIEDYDYWCKCYASGFVGMNVNETLLKYREDTNSFKKRDNLRRLRLAKCMIKWCGRMQIPPHYTVFVIYEVLKCSIPQTLIQKYHQVIYKK